MKLRTWFGATSGSMVMTTGPYSVSSVAVYASRLPAGVVKLTCSNCRWTSSRNLAVARPVSVRSGGMLCSSGLFSVTASAKTALAKATGGTTASAGGAGGVAGAPGVAAGVSVELTTAVGLSAFEQPTAIVT